MVFPMRGKSPYLDPESGDVRVLTRAQLRECGCWRHSFCRERKDHRFYELVEDTIDQGFEYGYFGLTDATGKVRAIQPFFVLDQDLLAGMGARVQTAADIVRRLWPRFLRMRTLMVGCAVGEGHLDEQDGTPARAQAMLLARTLPQQAQALGARLIVMKEFPARYRSVLARLGDCGFARIPSMPMTTLNIDYADFDDYMRCALGSNTRRKWRIKFRNVAKRAPLELSIVRDVTPIIDSVYPLYLAVYERSSLQFEKLTKAFLCGLGLRMPDKVRFFVWRIGERAVAFSVCMLQGDSLYAEYVGFDYGVAFDMHLYHCAVRDMIGWGIANGFKRFRSSALNYEPKLHMRSILEPLDIYIRHTSPALNALLARVLPWMEPTRQDPLLKRFPNYNDIWSESPTAVPQVEQLKTRSPR